MSSRKPFHTPGKRFGQRENKVDAQKVVFHELDEDLHLLVELY